jgi:hypothetical protein
MWVGAEFADDVGLEFASIIPPRGHASRVSPPKIRSNDLNSYHGDINRDAQDHPLAHRLKGFPG